jgi:mannose-6-phosphate isomerase-like protein (cupin superfamily)
MNPRKLHLDDKTHSERHEYPEGLFVTDGEVHLIVDGKPVRMSAGGIYIVPPGTPHSVRPGPEGTVVSFE